MGRQKQYERNDLVDRAVDLFHRQGFEATTTAQLVDALGVNRKSMYAEFGSKQGLFEAVLTRYAEHHLTSALAAVEARDASLAGIQAAFDGYVRASSGWARGRGCLLANTAVERAAADAASRGHVEAYFDRLHRAFRSALERAVREGELRDEAPLPALASFLTMSLVGVAVLARAQANPRDIGAARDVVMATLAGHRPVSEPSSTPAS